MEEKKVENKEKFLDIELKTTLLSAVVGGIVGVASFFINYPPVSLVLALVILAVFMLALKKTIKEQKGKKWWFSNAAIVYIFVWFVVWTILFNTQIAL